VKYDEIHLGDGDNPWYLNTIGEDGNPYRFKVLACIPDDDGHEYVVLEDEDKRRNIYKLTHQRTQIHKIFDKVEQDYALKIVKEALKIGFEEMKRRGKL